MNANDVYDYLCRFIDNEFNHLRKKVDWILALLIGNLATMVVFLIVKLAKIL